MAAPRLGKLGDRIGTQRILIATMIISLVLLVAMSFVTSATQLGVLRFLLGFADGAMMPAVQTLLVRHSRDNVTGRIFGYNQSFMYLGNVAGPLLGAAVSAATGYRWVFFATAMVVLVNVLLLRRFYRRPKTTLTQPVSQREMAEQTTDATSAHSANAAEKAKTPG
jgi:DHA1 family multidrug resistance protein-like MFS transporter